MFSFGPRPANSGNPGVGGRSGRGQPVVDDRQTTTARSARSEGIFHQRARCVPPLRSRGSVVASRASAASCSSGRIFCIDARSLVSGVLVRARGLALAWDRRDGEQDGDLALGIVHPDIERVPGRRRSAPSRVRPRAARRDRTRPSVGSRRGARSATRRGARAPWRTMPRSCQSTARPREPALTRPLRRSACRTVRELERGRTGAPRPA